MLSIIEMALYPDQKTSREASDQGVHAVSKVAAYIGKTTDGYASEVRRVPRWLAVLDLRSQILVPVREMRETSRNLIWVPDDPHGISSRLLRRSTFDGHGSNFKGDGMFQE